MGRSKNAGVAGYAEAFRPVQSDSQTSEWYSYFENDVLVHRLVNNCTDCVGCGFEEEACSFLIWLNIQILNFLCILGNEIPSWLYLITHKRSKSKVYF